ncbi:MAG: hypothetical protein NZ912_02140, partial [Ignisphaera sp.]|nr:hypothetical protein [Ignisphaera sp.]
IVYGAKYLKAHIRMGDEPPNLNKINPRALSLSRYVLLLSMTSVIFTPIVFTTGDAGLLPSNMDIIIFYVITLPLLLFILLTLYMVFKQGSV